MLLLGVVVIKQSKSSRAVPFGAIIYMHTRRLYGKRMETKRAKNS